VRKKNPQSSVSVFEHPPNHEFQFRYEMARILNALDYPLPPKGMTCFHAEQKVKPQDSFPFDKLTPLPGIDEVKYI
jgi:hypothetical protein